MRLLPRINLKRQAWPGGPEVGEVLQAHLSPGSTPDAGLGDAPEPADDTAAHLLLLLR